MRNQLRSFKRWKPFAAVLVGLFFSIPAFSQMSGKITGIVKDAETGDPLIGVNMMVVGTHLGSATDSDGHYFIVNVPVGTHHVQASMIGYKTVTKTDVRISLEQVTKVNFNLETAVLEGEKVVIVAERDILHKEISNSQQVVLADQIVETAGVQTLNQFLGSQAGITDERYLSIRGGSANETGAIVNGISWVNPRIGKAEATVPLSAVEQISLQSGGFSAEYGNYRSGILNVTTKSGDKSVYHGTFNYSRNVPHMKRFGESLYDPTNFGLSPYMDPVVSFLGTKEGWYAATGNDTAEALYQEQQHESFRGWNDLAARYNRGKAPEEQVTPMDLYLWSAWMHQAVPDFDRLEELYPQYTITEEQKKAIIAHAHEPEGEDSDYDLDFGFGG
ncbi:MAG: carboxypeptidase-like regulatory domain-containing protein, partial [Syntrophaceae bacterium]|nr:carboxypeptidase-like regulatory domain-containing protein [Syntrophaceae bacterium]